MKNIVLDEPPGPDQLPPSDLPDAAEAGFVAGLIASALVILVNALVLVLINGWKTGDYDLDFNAEASIAVIVLSVLAVIMFFRRREIRRAEQRDREFEAKLDHAETLLRKLEREIGRG